MQTQLLFLGEETFQSVWESSSDAMALSDPDGVVLSANPAYAELYAYPLEEIVGSSFAIIFPQAVQEWAVEQYHLTFQGSVESAPVEAQVQRADGSNRYVESRYSFISGGGRRLAMLSIIRDITDRKRSEEEHLARERAEAASRAKTEFLSRMSHELRTPLNAILGFGQLLEADDLPPEHQESVTYIMQSGRHLLRLVDEVLDVVRVARGSAEIASV